MADLGYTEIQLLGQNVNSYKDPSGKKTFAELLAAVGETAGIRRVRFTTSHPRDFGRDIVDAIDVASLATPEVVAAYCSCMNGKMSSDETLSVTAWEKTHPTEMAACDKESGWDKK